MKRVSQQGLHITANQRRRMQLQRSLHPSAYHVADPKELNERFPAFVGPYAPPVLNPDADLRAHWVLVDHIKRYGREVPEESFTGTPFLGDRDIYPQEYTA